ncbi:MAG: hypothetical protein GY877_03430 [Hyphomicrobium sp.]|nr:hypothetical protein [Hyphomicrobium sp.]
MSSVLLAGAGPPPAQPNSEWDQIANIEAAATRLAVLQRRRGASRAYEFIDACYRTHMLSEEYTKALEACIAQDYMETQVLALIYSRVPSEALRRQGAPSSQMLAGAMGQRITAAFANYKMPVSYVEVFKKLVDEYGFPLFYKTLFPGSKAPPRNNLSPPEADQKQE